MTDYLEKYREALRRGDEKEANKYYNKYKGDSVEEESSTNQVEEKVEESDEEVLKSPGDMTVDEAKDYADGIGNVEAFLELEKEGKNRTTLVDYLENKVE